ARVTVVLGCICLLKRAGLITPLYFMYEIVHNMNSWSKRAPPHAQRTQESSGCDHPRGAVPGSDRLPHGGADRYSMVRGDGSVKHTGALAPLTILAAEDAPYERARADQHPHGR